MLSHTKAKRDGFTLIELLVVVAIISILGSLLLASIMVMKTRSNISKTELLLQTLVTSIETMKSDYGYTRAIGVDKDDVPLDEVDLDDIDLGKELDPKAPFWDPLVFWLFFALYQ